MWRLEEVIQMEFQEGSYLLLLRACHSAHWKWGFLVAIE